MERARDFLDQLQAWWKRLTMIGGIAVMVYGLWLQVFADGMQMAARDWLGILEITERLEFVEINMPAPVVVEWDDDQIRQVGRCDTAHCPYLLRGERTSYGHSCGRPTEAIPFVQISGGQLVQVQFHDYVGIELTRRMTSFQVDIAIPESVPAGRHKWRTRITYPNCAGLNEPIPRWTPWWPLTVN